MDAIDDNRTFGSQGRDQRFGEFPLAIPLRVGQILGVARLGVDTIAVMDTELGEHLLMATVPVEQRHYRCNCLEIEVMAGPSGRLQCETENAIDHDPAGKRGFSGSYLPIVQREVIRNLSEVDDALCRKPV